MAATLIEVLKAILIGVVQGITEWLPISSTGHMILLGELLSPPGSQEFFDFFLVSVQLGSALAVAVIEAVREAGAMCAATTHYAELKAYALDAKNVTNASCEEEGIFISLPASLLSFSETSGERPNASILSRYSNASD